MADTVGAMGAALLALSEVSELPKPWLQNICEWPRSKSKYDLLAEDLDRVIGGEKPRGEWKYCAVFVLLRNIPFMILILLHAFLRVLPKKLLRQLYKINEKQ